MKKRRLLIGCLVLIVALTLLTAARADIPEAEENPSVQPETELLLTNTTDLVGLFLEGYDYPLGSWVWSPTILYSGRFLFEPWTIVWADTSNLPSALSGITNFVPTSLESVNAWPLWVTLYPTSSTVTVLQPWSNETLTEFSVSDGFDSWSVYEKSLYPSCVLFGINYTNWEVLVEEGFTQFSVPMVVTHAWLMDIGSRDVYWNNLEADCEAAEAAAAASMSSRFTEMDDDDDGGGDPCSITNLTQPFYVTNITQAVNRATTITWQSCQIFRYLVWEANSLSTNTQWFPMAYVWGATNASLTSWTDAATTNDDGSTVTQRFYRVQRLLGTPIAMGGNCSLAALPNGSLWGWGANGGEVGDGTTTERDSAVLVAPYPCGGGESPADTVALAAGYDFSVAVDANGAVWTWGTDNNLGQLGNGGESEGEYAPSRITGVTNVVSVAAGQNHALALDANRRVWAWGDNSEGELGIGGGSPPSSTNSPTMVLTQIVAVAAGYYYSVALDENGNIWTWGEGDSGQLGDGGYPDSVPTPTLVTNISNVIAIAAGYEHAVALTASNIVWTWGDNTYGELGDGTTDARAVPEPVFSNVVAIAAGVFFTSAVTSNGDVYGWGLNSSGQLGTNGPSELDAPTKVRGISNAVIVATFTVGRTALAATIDQGTNGYWGWGDDSYGEVGNDTNNIIQYAPAQVQFSNRTNGCSCYQLGTSGTFTADATGTLYLFYNDDFFDDDVGAYTATVYQASSNIVVGTSNVIVEATNNLGVAVGPVTNGVTYSFSASGFCSWTTLDNCRPSPTNPDCTTDANGNHADGQPADCVAANWNADNTAICPVAHCFSLVGKIE